MPVMDMRTPRPALEAEGRVDEEQGLPEVIVARNVPVLLYAKRSEVETEALQQLVALAESPLPVGYVAAMPDVHVGKGVTIGTVFASEKYVAPMAVGVDIVPFDGINKDTLSNTQLVKIQQLIKRRIPTGRDAHKMPLQGAEQTLDKISNKRAPSKYLEEMMSAPNIAKQLGTLGGGNHFLEVVYDETGRVWIMLHSGSRNIGNSTATHYDRLAKQDLLQRGIESPSHLNYLELESKEGQRYLQDMLWCQEYAWHNRSFMRDLMIDIVEDVTKASVALDESVNIHHNFCQCERCMYTDPKSGATVERDLYVTRKGATPAAKGQMGLIPGSMGTGSYVTMGRGQRAVLELLLSWGGPPHEPHCCQEKHLPG
ncbi:g10411 [Coccomyxa elongata]